ncbi:hypothetical protein L8C07_02405 [Paenibacillus sp. CMAA1739]|uniref:hypothetical protein n=1 Tax=Paenibacillus ottowii TaxID=2315729 RepID=UPI002DD55499|nr:hypothetical protein [Paenibacillus sp. CMAA1739]
MGCKQLCKKEPEQAKVMANKDFASPYREDGILVAQGKEITGWQQKRKFPQVA